MKKKYIFLLFLVFNITTVYAEDEMRWSIKGFGTFGYSGTDTDKLGFFRTITQTQSLKDSGGFTTDSRLGLQVDVDINNSLHATVQWVAREHAGDFFEQNLDWAFLRWSFSDATNIRLGRLGADLFLLSDYRNVGYAYPWVRPPHEFYRNLALYHFDGVDLNHQFYFGDDVLSIKLFAGYSFNQVPAIFTKDFVDIEFTSIGGGSLKFETGNWLTRVGYSFLHLDSQLPSDAIVSAIKNPIVILGIAGLSQLIPALSIIDSDIHYYSLGAAYDNGSWLAQAEVSYIDAETTYFPDSISAYLSIGKRFSKVTLYTLFGISHSFQEDVNIPSPSIPSPELLQVQQLVDILVNKNGVDEKSISLGLRWDFYHNFAFKTQWSHFWLGSNGTQYWIDRSLKEKSVQVNVWSLGIDFIF